MDDWDKLDKMFDNVIKKMPEKNKKLMEEVGDLMKNQVIDNIESTTKEKTGNLKAGVTKKVGSRGGYVAVKPNYGIAPHSHLAENGHKVVRDGVVVGWANGKHMYRNAIDQVSDEIEKKAQNMANELVGEADD